MNFADEVNQIKLIRNQVENTERESARQRVKENFALWIQHYIDNLEEIKDAIRNDASQGKVESVVVQDVLRIQPPIFGSRSTRIIGGLPPNKGLVLRGEDNDFECAKGSLLISRPDSRGFNGRWYYVDERAGKSVIINEKLIELWELLESIGLRPFFSGGMDSASLCVRL